MGDIIARGRQIIRENNGPSREATNINLRRSVWQALFAMCVNVLVILFMAIISSDNPVFRNAIYISHGITFFIMAVVCVVSYKQRGRVDPSRLALFMQDMGIFAIVGMGITIAAVDNTGSGAIAYIIVCLIIGVASIMRPLRSGITYIISFLAFIAAVHSSSSSIDVFASATIYGTIATVIGYAVTLMIWRSFKTATLQRKRLGEQKAALEKANTELRNMAYLDSLTNLPNRRLLDDMVRKEVSRAGRHGHTSSIIMIDIDNFKRINDLFGHPAGDSLLIQFGELLSENMRQYDILSRLAGDEFVVLLPQTSFKHAQTVSEKLRSLIDNHTFVVDGEKMNISASFGVSELVQEEGATLIKQYSIADNALYEDKSHKQARILF